MHQIDPGYDAAASFLHPPHDPWPLRSRVPALASKTYFNFGGQGPLPDASLAAITEAFVTFQQLGPFTEAVWPTIFRTLAALSQRLTAWFGVEAHRAAFAENVSSGCGLPLWGLTWQAGDEQLIGDAEHDGVVAACREPARRHGLTIATLPVTEMLDGGSAAATTVLDPPAAVWWCSLTCSGTTAR